MTTSRSPLITAVLVFMIAVVGGAANYLFFKTYGQKDTVDIHAFPRRIDGWTAEEIPISDEDYAILETRNAFVRRYTHQDGRRVYLFIVYSQHNRKVSHPPEICYTGGGAAILDDSKVSVSVPGVSDGLTANRVMVESGPARQLFYYFFKAGDAFTPNYWKHQILVAFKGLRGLPDGSALIRVSTDLADGVSEAEADRTIQDFIRTIVPVTRRFLP